MTTSHQMIDHRCARRRMRIALGVAGVIVVTATTLSGAWAESSSARVSGAQAPSIDGSDVGEVTSPISADVGVDRMALVFSDEFNGSSLDTSVWRAYHNTYGDGNHELACLTPQNVTVSGGSLQITARRETVTCPNGSVRRFTSGFITTRDTRVYFPRYGRYEIRAKVPHGQGLWPAFWLRHRDGASTAEVDVMEYFHSRVPGRTTQSFHRSGVSNVTKKSTFFEPPTGTPEWHTWAVDIRKAANGTVAFTFLTDGVSVLTYTDTQANWSRLHAGEPVFDIAINMAVGGDWTGRPDDPLGWLSDKRRCAQSGVGPNRCVSTGVVRATFPSTYEVDYIRVWQST